MSSQKLVCCPGCSAHVHPVRPTLLGRALVPLAWVYCAAMVFGGSFLGPALFTIAPFVAFAGACMIRTAHDLAFREPHCPHCEKILGDEPAEQQAPASLSPSLHQAGERGSRGGAVVA